MRQDSTIGLPDFQYDAHPNCEWLFGSPIVHRIVDWEPRGTLEVFNFNLFISQMSRMRVQRGREPQNCPGTKERCWQRLFTCKCGGQGHLESSKCYALHRAISLIFVELVYHYPVLCLYQRSRVCTKLWCYSVTLYYCQTCQFVSRLAPPPPRRFPPPLPLSDRNLVGVRSRACGDSVKDD